jgi:PHD/YefM family antitoxin component YafN of YafNO toxin-antitoxin module
MVYNVGDTVVASISEAKAGLARLVDEERPTVVFRGSKPVAAVVPMDQFNEYLALKKLARHPALLEELLAGARKAARTPLAHLRRLEDLERVAEKVLREEEGRTAKAE